MKGVLLSEFGGIDKLTIKTDLPIPSLKSDEILIDVKYFGINPSETYVREGRYGNSKLPLILGTDSCGVVEALGSDVAAKPECNPFNLKVGQRVFAINKSGGSYAAKTTCNYTSVFPLPDKLTFQQGAGLGVSYFTAMRTFSKISYEDGDVILIMGASGGTGIAHLQVAKANGFRVIATAGSEKGIELVKKNGADAVFNHSDNNYVEQIKKFSPKGINIIVDMLTHKNIVNDLDLIALKGQILTVGSRGAVENLTFGDIILKEAKIQGVFLYLQNADEFLKEGRFLVKLLSESDVISPIIGKEYELKDIGLAHKELIELSYGSSYGKKVVKI